MKTQILRKRFWTWEAAASATTISLEPGFGTPKACIIHYVENSATIDSYDTSLAFRGVGISMIGSTDTASSSTLRAHCVHCSISDGVSPTTVRRNHLGTRFLRAQNQAGTTYWDMATVAFITDAIRITPLATTPQTNGHLDCIFIVFGGDDLRAGVGTYIFSGTAGGTSQLTSLGFQPDLILVGATIVQNNGAGTDDFRLCWGAATRSPLKQKGVYMHVENSASPASTDIGTLSSSDTMITYSTSNAVGPYTHTISGITTGGWTFTSSAAASGSNNIYNYLALRTANPSDFALVDLVTATGTGNQSTGLGISGFIPKAIFGAATNASSDNTRATTSPASDGIHFFGGQRSNDSKYFTGEGTIQTNSGGTAVTGTGTAFGRLGPGDKIYTITNTLLGTVSSVTSNRAMTLAANATASFASTNFVYSTPGQFCITYGAQDAQNPSNVFSAMASKIIEFGGGAPTDQEVASLTDFDTRNGFNLNFTTTSGTARRGWIVASKGNEGSDANRRRIP